MDAPAVHVFGVLNCEAIYELRIRKTNYEYKMHGVRNVRRSLTQQRYQWNIHCERQWLSWRSPETLELSLLVTH